MIGAHFLKESLRPAVEPQQAYRRGALAIIVYI